MLKCIQKRMKTAVAGAENKVAYPAINLNLSEIEVKCLVDRRKLASSIALESLQRELIYQVYLPKTLHDWAKGFLEGRGIPRKDLKGAKQLRLRRSSFSSGEDDAFELVMKTPKEHFEGRHKVARLEISASISAKEFRTFSKDCIEGAVSKLRLTHLCGALPRSKVMVSAEIDILLAAGPSIQESPATLLLDKRLPEGLFGNYLMVEFEVADPGHLKELHIGSQPLGFLDRCAIDLTKRELSKIAKPLSNSRLGRFGFNNEAKRALEKLVTHFPPEA